MINAIIMASGYSKRMGENKLLLPYKNKYLIEHTLDVVKDCRFNEVILVAQNEIVLNLGIDRGMKVIFNHLAQSGQSSSLRLGVLNSPKAVDYAFFTGDQPLMDKATINFLIKQLETTNTIIVPYKHNHRGTPVLFPNQYRDDLLALRGDTGGKMIIKENPNSVKLIEINNKEFLFDIDTKENYQELLKRDDT